jgi:heme-degrading monooxygenase HmoA
MIKRIVQLTLEPQFIEDFKVFFEERKTKIKGFDGCEFLELWQDVNEPNKFFTHSIWQTEHHLNLYRFSEFFKETWTLTKAMFAEKAQAWSVEIIG